MTNPFANKSWIPFLAGKKTYIMAGAIFVLGTLEAFGINIPNWLLIITGAGTVAAHRASIDRLSQVVSDVVGMVTYVDTDSSGVVLKQVVQSPEYTHASEELKTDMLNSSQLKETTNG